MPERVPSEPPAVERSATADPRRGPRRLARGVLSALGLLVLAFVAVLGVTALRLTGNPMPVLERDLSGIAVVRDSAYAATTRSGEARLYRDLHLYGPGVGDIHVTLSLPADATESGESGESRLPIVLVLGGLEVGRESLRYIGRHGRNALVSYEYPYSPDYWYEGTPIREIPAIQSAVLSVPAQVAAALHWTAGAHWADRDRIVLLGYSFGALFVPAAYRIVEASGLTPAGSIVAYGGADLALLFRANLDMTPTWQRDALAGLAAVAVAPIDPARHLPHIAGDMLLLNGTRDHQIPWAAVERLRNSKPEPRTIVSLDAGHMHPTLPDLTDRIVEESRTWLLNRGFVEP
jgi:hypothetical protein